MRLRPDVMLIDIRLSDGNGLDILAKQIQTCELNIIPIVITLHTYAVDQKLAMKHGAVHFFYKAKEWKIPVTLEQMIAARRAA